MLIFKNDASTMKGVLENSMHATNGRQRRGKPGDVILIYQTNKSLKPDEKPISYVMDFALLNRIKIYYNKNKIVNMEIIQ